MTVQNKGRRQLERHERRKGKVNDSAEQNRTTLIQPPIINENLSSLAIVHMIIEEEEYIR